MLTMDVVRHNLCLLLTNDKLVTLAKDLQVASSGTNAEVATRISAKSGSVATREGGSTPVKRRKRGPCQRNNSFSFSHTDKILSAIILSEGGSCWTLACPNAKRHDVSYADSTAFLSAYKATAASWKNLHSVPDDTEIGEIEKSQDRYKPSKCVDRVNGKLRRLRKLRTKHFSTAGSLGQTLRSAPPPK